MQVEPFRGRGLLILITLVLINVLNFIDRQLPYILVDSIRADLGLNDAQIGLMAGVAFAVVYSFAGLPLARLADRFGARWVITGALTFWSLATAASGFAHSFTHLILARIGVAAGEAGSTPAAHALISRVYPVTSRGIVLALFSLGVPIGSMLGLMLGGWINDAVGWRQAFFMVGLPGVVVAVVGVVLSSGGRGSNDAKRCPAEPLRGLGQVSLQVPVLPAHGGREFAVRDRQPTP